MFGQWMGDNRIDLELGNKEVSETFEDLKRNKEIIKNIDKDFFFKFGETVLNLMQTQQAEIDSLKDFKEIAESKVTDLNPIGLARTNQLLSRQCHKLQEENEKKDKIIDLMSEQLTTPIHSKEWVKEYYERKIENG